MGIKRFTSLVVLPETGSVVRVDADGTVGGGAKIVGLDDRGRVWQWEGMKRGWVELKDPT